MIFFLYGDDDFRSAEKMRQIRDKFREQVDKSGFNIVTLDGENLTLEQFNEATGQMGFLSTKRLIVIKNIFTNKKLADLKELVIAYLNRQKDTAEENFILFWQSGSPDKRTGLFKKLSGYKYAQEFPALTGSQLPAWIIKTVKDRGGDITAAAAESLSANIGTDLWQLSNEINKLLANKKDSTITPTDVRELTVENIDDNIFALTDALAARDTKKALPLLERQLQQGMNEQYLLTMIARQFRILLQLKSLADQNISPAQMAKAAGLHPFVVKKTMPLIGRYSLSQLKKIFQSLHELDVNMKSLALEPKILLDLFIVKNTTTL
ncbi:MAG: DNA polymerase III subunit delta [Candidatus Komeilibacteria bacterium]|nr:DNA polymerase III subunit delta [Candidatus Komeilibacteria bacterium]